MTELDILTADDVAELAQCEATIEAGLSSFMQTGTALLRIQDKRLHRATHATFEDYLRDRWHISRSRGYRLIEAATTVAAVSPFGDIPVIENEAQARAIAPIVKEHGPERAAEVLREVAESGPVTAKAITEASRPAHVTQTTRTTEATKVEHVVDMTTGEILNEEVTSEVWEVENPIERMLANDPDVRAANLRKGGTALLAYLFHPHPDAVELASIDAALTAQIADRLSLLAAQYRNALPRRLSAVKES